jgi:UDP-N-acetylmuramoyl-tripeptide--D-alanyl-D-alanine ligase
VIRLRIQNIVDSTGAELVRGDAARTAVGVSTDTRSLEQGAFFVALSGPNYDGNRFAGAALRAGAGGLLLRGPAHELQATLADLPAELPVLAHADPRRALSDLASWHRSQLQIPVIGITGSCGKTTTKNILMELLSTVRRTVGSPNSFNNDIGVPHTLFLADQDTETLIVEMGTNHPGEIAALCRTARPTAGIITNIGASHLEGLLSIDGVAREKGELAASLPRDGFCVLNADCGFTPELRAMTAAQVITFSVEGNGDLDAREPWFHSGGTTFRLEGREVTFPLLGRHNVQNLLAALAACRGLGVELDEVLPAVSRLSGGHRRMERHEIEGVTLFDDTYNANPESAKASVRVLAGLHGFDRRILVLGDMLELGEFAAELHHAVGIDAAANGIDELVLVGDLCRATAAGALEGGLAAEHIHHAADVPEAARFVRDTWREGDVVLVKGSRAVGLERLVSDLLGGR